MNTFVPVNQRPGWIFMREIILQFFCFEDLNLSDKDLVIKYHENTGGYSPYKGTNEYLTYNESRVHKLIVKALRLNILHTLSHERT